MRTFLRTLGFLKSKKVWLTSFVVSAALLAMLELVEPIFFREIIDALQENGSNTIARILVIWALVAAATIVTKTFLVYFVDVVAHKMHVEIWPAMVRKILQLSINFHNSTPAGKIARRIDRGADEIFWVQLVFLRHTMPRLFALIFLLPLIFFLNWKMSALLCVIVPTLGLLGFWGAKNSQTLQSAVDRKWSQVSAMEIDAIANICVIKSFVSLKTKMREFAQVLAAAHRDQLKVLKWWALMVCLAHFASIIAMIAVFAFGAFLHMKGEISLGEIVMFSGFAMLAVKFVEMTFDDFQQFLRRRSWIEKFFALQDSVPEIRDVSGARNFPKKVKGQVEFRDVCFSHDGESGTLKNVSFKAQSGQSIALVGHTGSGKSTTVNLLSRFFEIQSGQILLDGFDISRMKQDSLREQVGMVFQENMLFHTSILANLRIGNVHASVQEIEKACRAAHAWDFVKNFPKGLQTMVGERGVKLSGGEKQRVAIARAILKNPPVLVLDEATSALDAKTEKEIQIALENLTRGRTTFIVAHRLSTVKKADKILVFEKGRIVESGKFSTLMAKKGKFFELVSAQVSGILE